MYGTRGSVTSGGTYASRVVKHVAVFPYSFCAAAMMHCFQDLKCRGLVDRGHRRAGVATWALGAAAGAGPTSSTITRSLIHHSYLILCWGKCVAIRTAEIG